MVLFRHLLLLKISNGPKMWFEVKYHLLIRMMTRTG